MRTINNLIFLFQLLCVPISTLSKNLYVSKTGSDQFSYNSISLKKPWKSLEHSFRQLKPGDTLFIREGIYYLNSPIDLSEGALNGLPNKPIVIKSFPGENTIIKGSANGRALIYIEKNNYYLDGLTIIGDDIGEAVVYIGYDHPARHTKITNCHIEINSTPEIIDCTAPIRLGSTLANHCTISYCILVGTPKTAGVIIFKAQGIKFSNNIVTNSAHGIFFKHSNSLENTNHLINSFTNNFIYNCTESSIFTVSNYSVYRNNLILNSPIILGTDGGVGNGYVGADYNTIDHNTIYNSGIHLVYEARPSDPNKGCLNNKITNNIIMDKCFFHAYNYIPNSNIKSDFNLYPNRSDIIGENRISYSLDTWKKHNNSDLHSSKGTPIFENSISNDTFFYKNYKLKRESPGYKACKDGSDIGADISKLQLNNKLFSIPLTDKNGK